MFDPANTAQIYVRLKVCLGFFCLFSVYLPAGFACGKCAHAQNMAMVSSSPCYSATEAALALRKPQPWPVVCVSSSSQAEKASEILEHKVQSKCQVS